jgi:hypothetical protein
MWVHVGPYNFLLCEEPIHNTRISSRRSPLIRRGVVAEQTISVLDLATSDDTFACTRQTQPRVPDAAVPTHWLSNGNLLGTPATLVVRHMYVGRRERTRLRLLSNDYSWYCIACP